MLGLPATGLSTQSQAQTLDGAGIRELYRRAQQDRSAREEQRQRQWQNQNLQRPSRPRRSAAPTPPPAPEAVDKQDDAKVLLVIGDFLASGLAEGLGAVFAQDPAVRVVDRASGSSGIVRDDYFNWPEKVGAIIAEEKPAAVLLMLGSNDRQQMKTGDIRLEPKTDAWMKEYQRRAGALAEAVQKTGTPLIWVGMPSFKLASLNADMVVYNDIYRAAATEANADYVDIWDGFADENGAFVATGPDVNGQPARLRSGDGINMTAAGKRKIAFYAEKPIKRILGSSETPSASLIGPAYTPGDDMRPGTEDMLRIVRTVPISLSDPELDGGSELLGGGTVQTSGTANEKLMREHLTERSQPGRADFFGPLPKATAGAPTITGSTTPATRPGPRL